MAFNEDARVKIPAILHLIRLGFTYIPQAQQLRREDNNIFEGIFSQSIGRLNPHLEAADIKRLLDEISLELDYEDLGEKFYQRLTSGSGIRLIDFQNFSNNDFHVTTELTCKNGDEEFRPDITLLINGMPLAFIEVKKPHNREGIIDERNRINRRFQQKHFRRFANITQLMVFSNNMEYEDGIVDPVFGAFYATAAYKDLQFNYFREDPEYPVKQGLKPISEEQENAILKDTNLMVIKHSPEFLTNKSEFTPTHRILTSLFSKERFAFILKYSLAYVREEKGLEKHIMRYPQLFATLAIAQKLSEGRTKGIIWHTQGSGKTALAYFNVKHLTDFFQKQGIIPKFYFVVDRIDLLIQASTEFSNRGLKVIQVNSRQDFIKDLKITGAIHNDSGLPEITVVNIQKFSVDAMVAEVMEYDIQIQRVFFLDEAHRSYNPKGNYLANLINSDKKAIKIALTGTPLLREVAGDYDSKTLFGNYIHKYYYNMSIADGYTLRLIREEIEGKFKMEMKELMDQIKIQKGDIPRSKIYAHPKFVQAMLDYIVDDLIRFRKDQGDTSLGGMVVCDSSEQARELFRLFEEKFGEQETDAGELLAAAPPPPSYGIHDKPTLKAALILHDENDKDIRKDLVKVYKKGNIDLLFVYNMLLTGFDAKRLKKLYLARVIQDHNLLQTLTRVNRPYKKFKYGYVVDFADISRAFDRTNRLYFDELQEQLGDEMALYSNLFKSPEEIQQEIMQIREVLFQFDTQNKEIFSQQIAEITDKSHLLEIVKSLRTAKELKNLIALNCYEGMEGLADFDTWNRLLSVAQSRLDNLHFVENIGNEEATTSIINTALEDIVFEFIKVSESELVLADQFKDMLRKTRESLRDNFDQHDPAFVSLREELERIFKKKNLSEVSQQDLIENMPLLRKIHEKAKELNRENANLKSKYQQDEKFARVHKRLTENDGLTKKQVQLQAALINVKTKADEQIQNSQDIMANEAFFKRYMMQLVTQEFLREQRMKLDFKTTQNINQLIVSEYLSQFNNTFLR
jgi:type I restriction enzyme R subunit